MLTGTSAAPSPPATAAGYASFRWPLWRLPALLTDLPRPGAGLIAAPWIFQFSEHTAPTVVAIVLGMGLNVHSPFTNYELGIWKVAPMAVHNLIDIAAGAQLAASPWLFGFADESQNVWVPHLVVGLAAVFPGLTTKQKGGYSYRKSATPTPAAG